MPKVRRLRRENPYYLIPIMMGMAGLLFSRQLEEPLLRAIVVLLSIGVPLFLGGNLMGRIRSDGLQRYLLIAGMMFLTLGAVATFAVYPENFGEQEVAFERVGEVARYLGMGSLLLGVLVVLYSTVRSEAMIDELGERFRHLADHMGEGFILTDHTGKIILTNPSLERIAGISTTDLIGRNALEVANEFGAELMARHTASRTKGVASEYQISWTTHGEERQLWVNGTPLYDRRGQRVGTLATVRDITELHQLSQRLERYTEGLQKLVEGQTQKLRESEARLRELLVRMNEGFLTLDENGDIRFANERICALLMYDEEEMIGRSVFGLVDTTGSARLRAAIKASDTESSEELDSEYIFVREDAAHISVKVSIARLDEDAEDGQRYSLVVTDVGELKDMQDQLELRARQLEQANRELRELDKAKDVFLSNVSHELRTPLGTIQGYLEMWAEGGLGKVQGPQAGALTVMSRNVERLSMMINEMIEFSRMEIRGILLQETIFHIAPLIEECVSSAHPHLLKKDMSATIFVPDDLPPLWGDRGKLGQVIAILLSNAIKFSNDGSIVQIHARQTGDARLSIDVQDTGIGIASGNKERIFRKFFQIDGSMTRYYQGTGIGLSIAKNIIEAHHGEIQVESVENQGSTFTLTLPGVLFQPEPAVPASAKYSSLDGAKVFVASREPEFAHAVSKCFETKGCRVTLFESGYDCARIARTKTPDLMLLDESLSDLSITDVLGLLQEEIHTSEIPVVVFRTPSRGVSGSYHDLYENVQALTKPFTPIELLDRSAAMLSGETAVTNEKKRSEGDGREKVM